MQVAEFPGNRTVVIGNADSELEASPVEELRDVQNEGFDPAWMRGAEQM